MHWLKTLFLCLVIGFLAFTLGCTSEKLGEGGFDVTLSIKGMNRATSVFSVMKALEQIDTLVVNGTVHKVTTVFFPIKDESKMGWKLNPDEPKYFHLKLWTLPGEKPVPIVDEQVSEKKKKRFLLL